MATILAVLAGALQALANSPGFLANFTLFGKIDIDRKIDAAGFDNKPLASMSRPVYTGFFRR
jgi:hypothetical protein